MCFEKVYGRFYYRHFMNEMHGRLKNNVAQIWTIHSNEADLVYVETFAIDKIKEHDDHDPTPYLKHMFKYLPSKFGGKSIVLTDDEAKQIVDAMNVEWKNRDDGYDEIDYNVSSMATASRRPYRQYETYIYHLVTKNPGLSVMDNALFKQIVRNVVDYFRPLVNKKMEIADIGYADEVPEDTNMVRNIRVAFDKCVVTEASGLTPMTMEGNDNPLRNMVIKTEILLCYHNRYDTSDMADDVYSAYIFLQHEFLHAFGLDHNPNKYSILSATNLYGEHDVVVDPLVITPCDYNGLVAIYGEPATGRPPNVKRYDNRRSLDQVTRDFEAHYDMERWRLDRQRIKSSHQVTCGTSQTDPDELRANEPAVEQVAGQAPATSSEKSKTDDTPDEKSKTDATPPEAPKTDDTQAEAPKTDDTTTETSKTDDMSAETPKTDDTLSSDLYIGVNRFYNNLTELFDRKDLPNPKYLAKGATILFYIRNCSLNIVAKEIDIVLSMLPGEFNYCFLFAFDHVLTDHEYGFLEAQLEQLDKNHDSMFQCHYNFAEKSSYSSLMVVPKSLADNTDQRTTHRGSQIDGHTAGLTIRHVSAEKVNRAFTKNEYAKLKRTIVAVAGDETDNHTDHNNDDRKSDPTTTQNDPMVYHQLPLGQKRLLCTPDLIIRAYPFNNINALSVLSLPTDL